MDKKISKKNVRNSYKNDIYRHRKGILETLPKDI